MTPPNEPAEPTDRAANGDAPVLVACSHGTRSEAGRAAMDALRADLGRARPGLEVAAAHVDVHGPWLADVLTDLAAARRNAVVVPLLLSSGYHVKVDIAQAVGKAAPYAVATPALGPDPALAAILDERLAAAGAPPDATVILAAAGSSDPASLGDVEATAALLAARRGTEVTPAYLAAAAPTVPDAVAAARASGRPIAVATYLLAPGLFASRLTTSGADHVATPLTPHPSLTTLALSRYDAAAAAHGAAGHG